MHLPQPLSIRNFDTYDEITSLKPEIIFLKTKLDEKETQANYFMQLLKTAVSIKFITLTIQTTNR